MAENQIAESSINAVDLKMISEESVEVKEILRVIKSNAGELFLLLTRRNKNCVSAEDKGTGIL